MIKLKIGGIKEASTIDYPGEMVSVIFLCNCPFKCPFCQNWSLVLADDCTEISTGEMAQQLERNRKYITGVCLTGGEPTVQIEGIIELLQKTREMGLLNKLDTNGFYPDRIKRLLDLNLLDYIALDVKSPISPEKYGEMIGNPALGEIAVRKILEALQILERSSIAFEVRTTIVPGYNDTAHDMEQIAEKLSELKVSRYVLQQFRSSGGTLDKEFSKIPATAYEILVRLGKIAKKNITDVRIRTIEAGEETI